MTEMPFFFKEEENCERFQSVLKVIRQRFKPNTFQLQGCKLCLSSFRFSTVEYSMQYNSLNPPL